MQGFKITLVLILNLFPVFSTIAQEIPANRFGIKVITDFRDYQETVKKDSLRKMVELKTMIPGILYDLRYATKNNFMHRRMYPARTRTAYLRLEAALALRAAQEKLKPMGLGLKVWDAYRPYSVTVRFWELVKDERYVANPSKGSGHNRGVAVDLTLVDLATGRELDMGTDFDNFSDTAHHVYTKLPDQVLRNRKLLKETMEQVGFVAFDSEWWHYGLRDGGRYEVVGLRISKLAD